MPCLSPPSWASFCSLVPKRSNTHPVTYLLVRSQAVRVISTYTWPPRRRSCRRGLSSKLTPSSNHTDHALIKTAKLLPTLASIRMIALNARRPPATLQASDTSRSAHPGSPTRSSCREERRGCVVPQHPKSLHLLRTYLCHVNMSVPAANHR